MAITFKQFLQEQEIYPSKLLERKLFQTNDVSYKIAKQMVSSAIENSPTNCESLAKKLASNFYHQILQHIDVELKFQKDNPIQTYEI